MPDVLVKGISVQDKERLRVQAALNGHSMQEELRRIIHEGVNGKPQQSFYEALKESFAGLESEGFALPARSAPRSSPSFD